MSTHKGESTNHIIEQRCGENVCRTMTQLADCTRHLQEVLAGGSRAQIEQAMRLWDKAQTDAAGAVRNYREFFDIGMEEWMASDGK